MRIDLHTHSTFSDGTLSPRELVRLAVKRSVSALALTDHDTTQGLPDFLSAGEHYGIEVVPGIEISTRHREYSLHVLGYGIRHNSGALENSLEKIQAARKERNHKILAKLQDFDIDISSQDLAGQGIGQIGRPHIARVLVERGVVKTIQEGFVRFLRRGGSAFVEQERPEADKVIAMIKEAGGIAFLAHPGSLDPSMKTLPGLINELKNFGLAGIEAYYPSHSPSTSRFLKKLAGELNLLISGGTDFHGEFGSNTPLGGSAATVTVPPEIWETMKNLLQ
jgi:hypothetical protein